MLAWLKRKPERRSYSDAILQAFESAATTKAASAAATAATEAVAGLLARTLAGAEVTAPSWAMAALSPVWLAQVARELVRTGEHLSLMGFDGGGDLALVPSGQWYWRGPVLERDWTATATVFGPSDSLTRTVRRDEAVFLQWSRLATEPHIGLSPGRLARLAARAAASVEKTLGDEASGPVAQILAVPEGADSDSDEFSGIRDTLARARGKAVIAETTQGGFGDRASAPARDWVASRLGPNPPQGLVMLAEGVFTRYVAACGASAALFTEADGTAQREALRRWHLCTVLPVAELVGRELSERLDADIRLRFDGYALDLQARASSVKKLTDAGMALDQAVGIVGLLLD